MILARLGRDAEIGTKIGGTQLSDQLLSGITFIAPALAPEFAAHARGMPRPVRHFMQEGRVVALGPVEALERGSCTRSASIAQNAVPTPYTDLRTDSHRRPVAATTIIGAWQNSRFVMVTVC